MSATRRMRCILCPRWFVPRFYRYRGIDRISITCSRPCANRFTAKHRQRKGAA